MGYINIPHVQVFVNMMSSAVGVKVYDLSMSMRYCHRPAEAVQPGRHGVQLIVYRPPAIGDCSLCQQGVHTSRTRAERACAKKNRVFLVCFFTFFYIAQYMAK